MFVGGTGRSARLEHGWRHVAASPGTPPADDARWTPVTLPNQIDTPDAEQRDHWYRLDSPIPAGAILECQGLATHATILIDGAPLGTTTTMFRPLVLTVPHAAARIEIRIHALHPPRGGKRPRWRNRLVPDEGWRSIRTALIGRTGTGVPIVGPYRPILLHPPGAIPAHLSTTMHGPDGIIALRLEGAAGRTGTLEAAGRSTSLHDDGPDLVATLTIPDPPLWWPHTHGDPALLDVAATLDGDIIPLGRTGFRRIGRRPGQALAVNGVPIFCRGALWTGHGALQPARDAGLNMIRVPGTALYPDDAFFAEADRLGILVWQDFMFARFDYPEDPAFLAEARAEADALVTRLARHPSLAVLCGGDETIQAAAMAGRPSPDWAHPLFDTVLREASGATPYVPNAPSGDPLPFAKSADIAHYFGVGAYLQPPADAAGVRFAAACLAFANPEDPATIRAIPGGPGGPAWRVATPRDPNVAWDFEDVRDHYVRTLFDVDPAHLRRTDPERWLALGRAAIALCVQAAFTSWRTDPDCHGALVLALQDGAPGPGWGMVASDGRPKSALHALARCCRPVQVLLADAGLDGVVIHLINDTPDPVDARLVLRAIDRAGAPVTLAEQDRTLPPRSQLALPAIAVMGRFQDLTGAWRFGPAPYAVLAATLTAGDRLLSESTLFPQGPSLPCVDLGLEAEVAGPPWTLTLQSRRFAQFTLLDDDDALPAEDHLHLWPGCPRTIALSGSGLPHGSVTALNGLHPAHYRARA